MNVARVGRYQAATVPLSEGKPGTRETIDLIRRLVDQGIKDPVVRRTATEILRPIPPYRDEAEVRALYQAVISGWSSSDGTRYAPIRYTKHMVGKQTLQRAADVLETGAGDCVTVNAILLPAMLGAVGYHTRLVTIANNPEDPDNFSHVYSEAFVRNRGGLGGRWISLDAAREDAAFGRSPDPTQFWDVRYWPLTEGSELLGSMRPQRFLVRKRRLFPRFGLGQDDNTSILANVLAAAPAIETGAANIVRAANAPAYYPVGGAFPGTYPGIPGGGISLSAGAGANTGVWIVVGLLAIVGLSLIRR